MLKYENLRGVFQSHLGPFFNPSDILDGEDGLNCHMYLGEILYECTSAAVPVELRQRVVNLVSALHVDGDDLCKELVHVSFFENMDHLPRHSVRAIRDMLPPPMKSVMDNAFKGLGYEYDGVGAS